MEITDKLKGSSLKDVVQIPPGLLELARKTAYDLFIAEKFDDVEVLLQGILAADNQDAWSLALYGAIMRKKGKFKEALVLMETAHALAPDNDNIRTMRDEIVNFGTAMQAAAKSGAA